MGGGGAPSSSLGAWAAGAPAQSCPRAPLGLRQVRMKQLRRPAEEVGRSAGGRQMQPLQAPLMPRQAPPQATLRPRPRALLTRSRARPWRPRTRQRQGRARYCCRSLEGMSVAPPLRRYRPPHQPPLRRRRQVARRQRQPGSPRRTSWGHRGLLPRRVLKPLARGRVPIHDEQVIRCSNWLRFLSRPRGIAELKERTKIPRREPQKSTRQR